jgi:hypothetical protein
VPLISSAHRTQPVAGYVGFLISRQLPRFLPLGDLPTSFQRESSFADFTISGGNGDSTANGIDAEATINGQSFTSATSSFTVPTPGGNLVLGFGEGFLGPFDPFTVAVREQKINLGTQQRNSLPRRAARATINGLSVKQHKGRFVVSQNGVEVALKFAPGFRGKFDPFTISAAADGMQASDSPLAKEDTDQIRKLIEPLLCSPRAGRTRASARTADARSGWLRMRFAV